MVSLALRAIHLQVARRSRDGEGIAWNLNSSECFPSQSASLTVFSGEYAAGIFVDSESLRYPRGGALERRFSSGCLQHIADEDTVAGSRGCRHNMGDVPKQMTILDNQRIRLE